MSRPSAAMTAEPGIAILASQLTATRRGKDLAASLWMWGALLVAIVPLGAIVLYLIQLGAGVISLEFVTSSIPISPREKGPGMGPAVAGTLLLTGLASALAIPLGVLAAVYLNEYGKRGRLATVVRFLADVMTGVPSIVMGLFIYSVWVLHFGLSGFAGALALACLMLPIVIRSTEEMLRLVPDELRQASLALGNTTWRTVVTVVLPAALPGIVSGAMLAVARAAGETAPVLFCVGIVSDVNWNAFSGSNTTLSAQIFANAQSPFVGAQDRAWGAAFTLVVLVFLLTVGARFVSARFTRKRGGL